MYVLNLNLSWLVDFMHDALAAADISGPVISNTWISGENTDG